MLLITTSIAVLALAYAMLTNRPRGRIVTLDTHDYTLITVISGNLALSLTLGAAVALSAACGDGPARVGEPLGHCTVHADGGVTWNKGTQGTPLDVPQGTFVDHLPLPENIKTCRDCVYTAVSGEVSDAVADTIETRCAKHDRLYY